MPRNTFTMEKPTTKADSAESKQAKQARQPSADQKQPVKSHRSGRRSSSSSSNSSSSSRKSRRSRRSHSSGFRRERGAPKGKGKGKFIQVCFSHHPLCGRICPNEDCHRLHLDTTDPAKEQRWKEAIASYEAYKASLDTRYGVSRSSPQRGRRDPGHGRHEGRSRHPESGRARPRGHSSSSAASGGRSRSHSYNPLKEAKRGARQRSGDRSGSREKKARKEVAAPVSDDSGSLDVAKDSQPPLDGELWPFRRFLRLQLPGMDPQEAISAYKAYESLRRQHLAQRFAREHQDDGLLRDLHCAASLLRTSDWQKIRAQRAAADFCKELYAGSLAQLSLTLPPASSLDAGQEMGLGMRKLAGTAGSPPHFLLDPTSCSMTFEAMAPELSLWDLHELLQAQPGFLDVSACPALPGSLLRAVHACFDTEAHLDVAMAQLTGAAVKARELRPTRAPRHEEHRVLVVPDGADGRDEDSELAARLITALGARAGIPEGQVQKVLDAGAGQAERQLDIRTLYLRRVHHLCLYSAVQCADQWELAERCGAACLRMAAPSEGPWGTGAAERAARLRPLLATATAAEELPPVPSSLEEESLRSLWASQCRDHTTKEAEGRYRCRLCTKLFKGEEYVAKHLLKVHPQLLQELSAGLARDGVRKAYLKAGEGPGWC